jgi:hypothetical protein
MGKTSHNDTGCGTINCPRCKKVYEILERYKFEICFTYGTKLFHLADHAIDLEEECIELKLRTFRVQGERHGQDHA